MQKKPLISITALLFIFSSAIPVIAAAEPKQISSEKTAKWGKQDDFITPEILIEEGVYKTTLTSLWDVPHQAKEYGKVDFDQTVETFFISCWARTVISERKALLANADIVLNIDTGYKIGNEKKSEFWMSPKGKIQAKMVSAVCDG